MLWRLYVGGMEAAQGLATIPLTPFIVFPDPDNHPGTLST